MLNVYRVRVFPLSDAYVQDDMYMLRIDQTMYIRETGVYKMVIAACGEDPVSRSLVVDGKIIVKNPSGYLPGQLVGFMRSYEVLYYVYLGLTAAWVVILGLRHKHMLTLHLYISGALFLGLIEAMLFRHAYHSLNRSGLPLSPLPVSLVMANLVSVIQMVCSKVLILLVSMGWCVVKTRFDRNVVLAIVIYSVLSFIVGLAHEVASSATHKVVMSFLISCFITAPGMLLDLTLVFWVFLELSRTRALLRERNQLSKLRMYRVFTLSLVLFLCASVGVQIYSIYCALTSNSTEKWNYQHWKSYYLLGGFPAGGVIWDFMYSIMLVIQMILFFPGERSSSYVPSRQDLLEEEAFLGAGDAGPTDPRNFPADVKAMAKFTVDDEN